MNNRHFILLVSIVFAFLLATPGFANQTNAMNSEITIVAGGSGYSDTLQIPDSQEPTIHYSRYRVNLISFQFEGLPINVKPISNIRFNFRLVSSNSHYSCGDIVYLYGIGTSSGLLYNGYGYSGDSFQLKVNVSNWSSSACTIEVEWF